MVCQAQAKGPGGRSCPSQMWFQQWFHMLPLEVENNSMQVCASGESLKLSGLCGSWAELQTLHRQSFTPKHPSTYDSSSVILPNILLIHSCFTIPGEDGPTRLLQSCSSLQVAMNLDANSWSQLNDELHSMVKNFSDLVKASRIPDEYADELSSSKDTKGKPFNFQMFCAC